MQAEHMMNTIVHTLWATELAHAGGRAYMNVVTDAIHSMEFHRDELRKVINNTIPEG
jgi:hypothetical protein